MPRQMSVRGIHFERLLLVLFIKKDLFLIAYPQGRTMSFQEDAFLPCQYGRKKTKSKTRALENGFGNYSVQLIGKKMPRCARQLTQTLSLLTETCHPLTA